MEVLEDLQRVHERLRNAYDVEKAHFSAPPKPATRKAPGIPLRALPFLEAKVVTLPNEVPDPERKEEKEERGKTESVSSENLLPPRISACSQLGADVAARFD